MKKVKILVLLLLLMSSSEAVLLSMDKVVNVAIESEVPIESGNARGASIPAQTCNADRIKRIIIFTSPVILLSALALMTYSIIRDHGNATTLAL